MILEITSCFWKCQKVLRIGCQPQSVLIPGKSGGELTNSPWRLYFHAGIHAKQDKITQNVGWHSDLVEGKREEGRDAAHTKELLTSALQTPGIRDIHARARTRAHIHAHKLLIYRYAQHLTDLGTQNRSQCLQVLLQ